MLNQRMLEEATKRPIRPCDLVLPGLSLGVSLFEIFVDSAGRRVGGGRVRRLLGLLDACHEHFVSDDWDKDVLSTGPS